MKATVKNALDEIWGTIATDCGPEVVEGIVLGVKQRVREGREALEAIRRLRGHYRTLIDDLHNSDAFPEPSKREWCRVMEENLKETEQYEVRSDGWDAGEKRIAELERSLEGAIAALDNSNKNWEAKSQADRDTTEKLEQKLSRAEADRDILVRSIDLLTPWLQSRLPGDMVFSRFLLEHTHYKQRLTDLRTAAEKVLHDHSCANDHTTLADEIERSRR